MRKSLPGLVIVIVGMAAGCAGKTAPIGPTTVRGTVLQAGFPSTPSAIAATDEAGRTTTAALGQGGGFVLTLPSVHTYSLAVTTRSATVPIVYPRQSGRLDATFVVRSDGAAVSLGNVHYLPAVPVSGFNVLAAASGSSQGGDCVDCVTDDPSTSCESGGSAQPPETMDDAAQADGSKEMAVAEDNAPAQVDGCGADANGGEGDQSEGDQQGQN